jgi:Tfp pilus assembly protein PilO
VQVDGGYHEVGRFLAEIGNLSRIVQVRNLEMIASGDIGEDGDRQVTATFMAETYGSKRNSGGAAAVRGSSN